jgi:SAM-dependent methyltransferase
VSGSVGFDRAADFYDETRDLDPAARQRLTDVLVREVVGKDVLEVGIGTGLVGLALARRGVWVSGVDLSERMLQKLVAKFERPGEVDVRVGDATALPYDTDSFDAVLSSQMLHLVDEWRTVLDELVRVVRPGGVVLIDLGNEPDSGWGGLWREVAWKFWDFAAPHGRRVPEVWTEGLVAAEMANRGLTGRPLPRVTAFQELSLADVISRLEQGLWSACWSLPADQLADAAERTRAWARERYPDLDTRHRIHRVIEWHAYDVAG